MHTEPPQLTTSPDITRPKLEIAAYYFLALFFAIGFGYCAYLIFYGGKDVSSDDRIVFATSVVYVPIIILLVIAARRPAGRFQPILLACLLPFSLGFLVAPFMLLAASKAGPTLFIALASTPLLLAEVAYVTLWMFTLPRLIRK